jgi:hypothetical protein
MILCSSCGQPISDDEERFTYVVSRIHVGSGFSVQGGTTALLSKAEMGGQVVSKQFPAMGWHLCSRDCLQKWAAGGILPEPALKG